ncbi:MAG: TIGR03364 family FAD-dependent oxidoreductase [Thalassobius sp.]|nr:TIGR03364 family FAD-dependent oxidoreductase [Thalassovita sp.]
MQTQETDILVVGAGIIGLAHAYIAAKAGYRVVVVEKDMQATGASVRNFGLIWPIGQAPGTALNIALKSRKIWQTLAAEAGFWLNRNGSMLLACSEEEMNVMAEFYENASTYGYNCKIDSAKKVKEKLGNYVSDHIKGALSSTTEMKVNPLEAIAAIAKLLTEKYNVQIIYGKAVSRIEMPYVLAGRYMWKAKKVFICSGDEFSILYPETFAKQNMLKCKLQMMKVKADNKVPENLPTISGGLTLMHYASFRHCMSLEELSSKLNEESSEAIKHGIHVLLSATLDGEFIVGDSHTYGSHVDPFIDEQINKEILTQLEKVYHLQNPQITKRWIGVYAKHTDGLFFRDEVEDGVHIISGLGGNGMTLSFGLAEENIRELLK